MAGSTKKGQINTGGQPKGRSFGHTAPARASFERENPDRALNRHLSWSISDCDTDPHIKWAFYKQRLSEDLWDTILPKLKEYESMTLSAVFVEGKKQNHGIDVKTLNKAAQKRLEELHIEAEAIHCLRLGGQLRIYGYLDGTVYHIVWYDDGHGDNADCVCRSHKRHT